MVTWFTNLRKLSEGMFLIFLSVQKNRNTLHLGHYHDLFVCS